MSIVDLSILYARITVRLVFLEVQAEIKKMLYCHYDLIRGVSSRLNEPMQLPALQLIVKDELKKIMQASLDFVDAAEVRFHKIYQDTAPQKEG